MVLQISWTLEAKNQFKEILDYWDERNGSSIYSEKLLKLVSHSIIRLQKHPEIGRITENPRIRLKIIKDYFLYYSFDDEKVIVLGIADMRRNPDFLKSLLG